MDILVSAWELIKQILDYATPVLPHALAIATALGMSWGGTQTLKYVWRVGKRFLRALNDNEKELERLALQVIAIGIAFSTLLSLWEWGHPIVASLVVGILSPYIYLLVMQSAYRKWPWLEAIVSGSPSVEIRKDSEGHICAIKVGDDKDHPATEEA